MACQRRAYWLKTKGLVTWMKISGLESKWSSESVFLFQDDPRVGRRVSGGGRGLRSLRHDEPGNDGYEKMTNCALI